MNPIIRWAGSKKALLPTLRQYWGDHKRYIEPFCGSGCLFFSIEPQGGVLGDINADLMGTYEALRDDPTRVAEYLLKLPANKEIYYKLRAQNPLRLSEVGRAARFLFLNRLCFNGIYRTNLDGQFNVPYGPQKKKSRKVKFDPDFLMKASDLLRRVSLVRGDFEKTLSHAEEGDFVYMDPPYAVSGRRIFSEYHPESFSVTDLRRLREMLKELDQKGAHFIISYADSTEGRALVDGWHTRRIRTRRNVAGFAGHRRSAYEILASNLEPSVCQ